MLNRLKIAIIPLLGFTFFLLLVLFDELLLSFLVEDYATTPYEILFYAIHIGFWLATAIFFNRLLKIFLWEGIANQSLRGNVPKLLIDITSLLVYILAITIIVGYVFKQPLTGLWATSGIVAIIIGFALRNIILDIFTGLAINIERPYNIGDWIEIHQRTLEQNVTGQVLEINWRATRLKTEKDTIVIIPNSTMSTLLVTNYWNPGSETRQEAVYCVDYSVPGNRVRRILQAAATDALNQPGFVQRRKPEIIIKNTTQLGVEYEIRYWINAWQKITPSRALHHVNEVVLSHLRTAGISLAYPKQDIYHQDMPTRHYDAASIPDRKNIISGVELFSYLSKNEIEHLANQMRYFVFKPGEPIVKSGEEGDSMFILVEGIADVLIEEDDSRSRPPTSRMKRTCP
jgi:small-conductance mechanosensitive channel